MRVELLFERKYFENSVVDWKSLDNPDFLFVFTLAICNIWFYVTSVYV
jgi:hypothetical protein